VCPMTGAQRKTDDPRMTHDQQRAAVPSVFRSYWESLARRNGYYNRQFTYDWAAGLADQPVLDAGCGESTTLGECQPQLTKLVGIDPIRSAIAVNPFERQKAQGTLESLPFADATFAAIYSDSVFEHIDDPRRVTSEMFRVLKPGGKVLINTNSVFNPFMFPNKILTINQRERMKQKLGIESEGTFPAPYRINTRRRMVRYLKLAGFTDIKIYRWGVPAMYHPKWFLVLQLLMELAAETPLFSGLKHRLLATAVKPR
jgi:SAM-dependent methyltransferase